MNKPRQKYSKEYKEEAVKLVTEQGYTVAAAAKNLGIRENMLWRWKKTIQEEAERTSSRNSSSLSSDEELRQLRAENKRLRMERDILKKATAYFAKESE